MKHIIHSALKQVIADRALMLFCIGIIVASAVYVLYVALSLHASDLQLAIRYTSYGETHIYRDKWYYLLSFIGLGLVFMAVHIGVMVKLHMNGLRQLGYAVGWLSVVMLALMFIYTHAVLGIAYLS